MKRTVRKDLLDDHIRPIAAIARKSQLATADMVSLRVPHKRTSDSDLASKAIAIAGAAERYHDVFRAQQLGSDFGEKCRAKGNELIQAMLVRDRSVLRLKAATGDAASYTSLVRDAIRVLNVMLHKQLARRPDLLSAWDKCRRYGKKPGVKRRKKRKEPAKNARA